MEVIMKNLPNILYEKTFMTVTDIFLREIVVHREPDRRFRVEFECGTREYYTDPRDVLLALGPEDDVHKVKMTFPTLKEIILVYG
jgi:hypothetical protein